MPFYSSLPFFHCNAFFKDLSKLISSHFPALKVNIIPKKPLNIGRLFNFKDRLHPLMTSRVVYKFTCPRCDRGIYIGSTLRLLKVRIDSHNAFNYRTGNKLLSPELSNIREHTKKWKSEIQYKDFEILGKASNQQLLAITESLFIKHLVPPLNKQFVSIPLYLSWAVSTHFPRLLVSPLPTYLMVGPVYEFTVYFVYIFILILVYIILTFASYNLLCVYPYIFSCNFSLILNCIWF